VNLVERSHEYCEELHNLLHGIVLPSNRRSVASAACLHLALEHHRAVVLLYTTPLVVSACAMLRIQLEAYVKGAWLNRCAQDSDLGRFERGKDLPLFGEMLNGLETALPRYGSEWASIRQEAWRPLSNYVHSGANQAWRRVQGEELAASGSSSEIVGGLTFASRVGALVALEFSTLADSASLAKRVGLLYASYRENSEQP
jgi:hypothetical protein